MVGDGGSEHYMARAGKMFNIARYYLARVQLGVTTTARAGKIFDIARYYLARVPYFKTTTAVRKLKLHQDPRAKHI